MKGYGFNERSIEEIFNKLNDNTKLTQEESNLYSLFASETNARMAEYALGNEDFIDKIVATEGSLAEKLVTKIKTLKKALGSLGKDNAEYLKILKAEKLYLKSAEKAGNARLIKLLLSDKEENKEIDASEEIQYNRKNFKFLHKNFPTEKENGSEAHRLAIWWARQPNVQTGDRTLISMNDRWYLVERFDDADNNYQVEEYITKAEFEKVFKEIQEYGRSGKVKSVSGSVDFIDKLNKQGYSLEGRKSSSLGYATQFGREDNQIQRVDKKQVEGGERTGSNGARDSSSSRSNKQEAKLSLKDSQDSDLTESQIEYFKDSKVRDEQGRLQVVYHGTNNEFYIFDKSKIKIDNLGRGFYFVDKKQIADSYTQRRTAERSGQERVVECYLLVKKPFNTSSISDEEIRDFLVYDYSQRGRVRYEYRKKYGIQEVEAEKYAEEMMNDEDIPILNGKKDYSDCFQLAKLTFSLG